MVLARAWRRRLYGGVITAAFVPAVLVVTLLALAFSGGIGGLGTLAQALSGPPAPAVSPVAARPLPARVLAAVSAPAPVRLATAPALRPTAAGIRPQGVPSSRSPTVSSPVGSVGPAHRRAGSSAPSHPAPGPTPHPTVIDQVAGVGSSVAGQLPGPVGQAATQALQTVATTADNILPPLPRVPK